MDDELADYGETDAFICACDDCHAGVRRELDRL